MRIALLADIHGNLPAFMAVSAMLERLQPDHVVLDGDIINGVPFSAEVLDRVRAQNWVVVRGNHEFYYLDFGTERAAPGYEDPARWGQLHWLIEKISPEQGAYLAMLPDERTFYLPGTQPLRVAHGVPGRNRVGFHNNQESAHIAAEIRHIQEHTVISAHTHVQIDRHIRMDIDLQSALQIDPHGGHYNNQRGGQHSQQWGADHGEVHRHWHLINPGSVGLPLNGDPTAQFAMLENVSEAQEAGGWRATMHRIPYDRRPALAAYQESGMGEAGGVITQLFYWEVVTAEPEIIFFYRWCYENGRDAEGEITAAFQAYVAATARDQYVRERDPLHQPTHATTG
ncbi:MAG: metallophosphoesterase family protein [Caldilineaceae bacterium]